MKPLATQNIDSLLGVVAPKQTQVGSNGTPADAALFGDLLGLLMAVQPMNPELQMPGVMPTDDANGTSDPLNLLSVSADTQQTSSLVTALQTQLNPELFSQMGMPQGIDASKGMLVTAITQNDSAVTLTLTPVADQDKPILLTISKDIFNNLIQQLQNGETPNADATNQAISPAMLQNLLTKLNAKEMTITNTPQQSPLLSPSVNPLQQQAGHAIIHTDQKSAAIQLLKEMSGSTPAVAIVAADEQLSTATEAIPTHLTAKNTKSELPQMGQLFATKNTDATLPITPVAQDTDTFSTLLDSKANGETSDEIAALIPEKVKDVIQTDQSGVLQAPSGTTQATNLKANTEVVSRPVLQLPENIQDLLKPYGKTVTLRIEPEHLGTATLSLQMQQGGLRARVVVETTEAKNMIEGSLGQLVTQLAKSNIKVDSVEVFIGGQTVADQQSSRQQRQQRSFRNGRFATDDKKLAGVMSAPASAISRYAFGAAPGGLNLVV